MDESCVSSVCALFIVLTDMSVLLENTPLVKFIRNYVQELISGIFFHILNSVDIDDVNSCCLCKQ